jgi:hypothetical protein
MKPYKFNPFELDLLRRLTSKVYLKSDQFHINRYPTIFWGNYDDSKKLPPGYQRINKRDELDNYEESIYDINNIYDIDKLGCYLYSYYQEGYIEIYGDRIHDCASRISIALGLDFIETRSLLQSIVLLHEIGHWFTHCCFKINRAQRMKFFKYQSKDIKETLAQLSVLWSTLGLTNSRIKNLHEIMDFLTRHQSKPYTQYLKLGKRYTRKLTIINRYVALLDLGNCDLEFLLLNNKRPNPHRTF